MQPHTVDCAMRVLVSTESRRRAGAPTAPGVLALTLALLCLVVRPPAQAQAQDGTLRFSLPISLESPTGQNIREFARQIQARTSGALRIEVLDKDRSNEEHDVVTAVAKGEVEIGAAPLNQFARDVPL